MNDRPFQLMRLELPDGEDEVRSWLKEHCRPNDYAIGSQNGASLYQVAIRDKGIAALFVLSFPNVTIVE